MSELPAPFGLFVGVRNLPIGTTEFWGYLYGTTAPKDKCDLFTSEQVTLALEAQAKRISELEASLADSNEALQVMGLKLEQAEADVARVQAMHEGLMKNADQMNAELEAENARLKKMHKAQSEQIDRLQDTVQSLKENTNESANTVGGPTPVMDAASACERKE